MKKILIASLLILVLGCAGKDIISALFLPNLSNQWTSNRGTRFFFLAANTNVNESAFTGSEQTNAIINQLSGSFKNYDVQFTFLDGAEKGITYKGNFIKDSNPLTMQVTGTNGVKITIEQR